MEARKVDRSYTSALHPPPRPRPGTQDSSQRFDVMHRVMVPRNSTLQDNSSSIATKACLSRHYHVQVKRGVERTVNP